jgi:hypothetical protein
MTSKKLSNKKTKVEFKTQVVAVDPVVLEPQKIDLKSVFSVLSAFVAVGGDFA